MEPPGVPATAATSTKSRFYISEGSEHRYVLPSDDEERQRLEDQSKALNEIFDHKLIQAPVELKDGDTVLDSGTGTGHWLLSLSKQLPPTINLIGIDISFRIFPPPQTLPPNTTFHQLSITSLSPTWSNTISLIHQRLLLVALQRSEWQNAIASMYQVLIPGGYVQLVEPNLYFTSPSQEIHDHKAWALRKKLVTEIRNVELDLITQIPQWLDQNGFVDLNIKKRGLPLGSWGGDLGKVGLEVTIGFWRAVKTEFMKAGGFGLVANEEEYDEIVDDLEKKCDGTPGTFFEFSVFVARKPQGA